MDVFFCLSERVEVCCAAFLPILLDGPSSWSRYGFITTAVEPKRPQCQDASALGAIRNCAAKFVQSVRISLLASSTL